METLFLTREADNRVENVSIICLKLFTENFLLHMLSIWICLHICFVVKT